MEAAFDHAGSRDNLLGAEAGAAARRAASVEARVGADAAPVFLARCGDDGLVPVTNSLTFYAAMHARGRPAELAVFNEGGHGFGVRYPPSMPAAWPHLLHRFGTKQGVFRG